LANGSDLDYTTLVQVSRLPGLTAYNRKETTQMEIILVKEKETPGTWRFKEDKEDHPMTIYLSKEQVKELGNPKSIKVTITAA
jgi:hypothetical protein